MRPTDITYRVNVYEEQQEHNKNIERANKCFERVKLLVAHLETLEGVSNIMIDNTVLEKFDRKNYNPTWPYGYVEVEFNLNGIKQRLEVK